MSPISIQDRIKFIKGLHIAAPRGRAAHADGEDSAAVSDGSTVSFVGNLPIQQKSDVLNSTLLAQLAANKQHNRQNDTKAWYDYYKYVLENIGWNVQSFSLAELSDANTYFSVDNLVFELAAAYLTGGELALFGTMIESLKQAKNEAATKVFDSSAKDLNKANFQIGIASDSGGNALFKIGAYTYSAEQNIDKVLFFTFGTQKIQFAAGNQTMVLNDEVYKQVREEVLLKLGDNAKNLVKEIEI
ncbi:hypothetical protein C8T65DRAFT_220266 [Cerioporus squamosus]|nr:hypothetical protein C8T65DRAFT_220266 [Cerioporus squamosus]